MAGPVAPADLRISTAGMKRILKYEPRDLTISVEAGIPYMDLSRELARNGQMIPLAGPYSGEATIGGIVASNIGDSRRRGYGTARDLAGSGRADAGSLRAAMRLAAQMTAQSR